MRGRRRGTRRWARLAMLVLVLAVVAVFALYAWTRSTPVLVAGVVAVGALAVAVLVDRVGRPKGRRRRG